ncbi:hypothetical protein D3C86_1911080 [compost metagenome]
MLRGPATEAPPFLLVVVPEHLEAWEADALLVVHGEVARNGEDDGGTLLGLWEGEFDGFYDASMDLGGCAAGR